MSAARRAVFSPSFPRPLANLIGANHLKIFFFLIFFITKTEHQNTQEQAASMRKPFQEKSLRWTAFQTVFSISKHKNHVMGNYSAERGPGFCFRKITPCNLLWAVSAAIPNAATGLESGLRCNFSRLKIVFGSFQPRKQFKSPKMGFLHVYWLTESFSSNKMLSWKGCSELEMPRSKERRQFLNQGRTFFPCKETRSSP